MKIFARALAAPAVGVLAACSFAPTYQVPETSAPAAYKESGDWQPAAPADAQPRGAWWQAFGDTQLDALEARVADANQNLKAAVARYEQAGAKVVELPVSAPFHTALLEPMVPPFTALVEKASFRDPRIPVVDNVGARPLTDAASVRRFACQTITVLRV